MPFMVLVGCFGYLVLLFTVVAAVAVLVMLGYCVVTGVANILQDD